MNEKIEGVHTTNPGRLLLCVVLIVALNADAQAANPTVDSKSQGLCTEMMGNLEYSKERETSSLEIGKRQRALQDPLILMGPQFSLGPYQSTYLNFYNDRPLFYDRTIRDSTNEEWSIKKEGFLWDTNILRRYEVSGWAPLIDSKAWAVAPLRWMEEMKEKDLVFSPNIHFLPSLKDPNHYGYKALVKFLKEIKDSPCLTRVNGKILVSGYGAMPKLWANQAENREVAERLRKDVRAELLIMSMTLPAADALNREWNEKKEYSPETLKMFQAGLQDALNTWGGVIVNPISGGLYLGNANTDLPRKADRAAFIARFPAILEVMNRPENHDKLLGCASAETKGYVNPFSGRVVGEYGTTLLRQHFDNVLLLNPDTLVMYEWNEFNENTCLMPTVANSMTYQRLVRFYSRKWSGKPTQPNPGDDLSIPNLVLSHRRNVRLGEVIRFELLNIPDSDQDEHYAAVLILKDEDGKVIQRFPEEGFTVKDLTAITYKIPSEQLSRHQLVIPEVEVTNSSGAKRIFNGFQYIRIEPTYCWDYKEVLMPLRDLLKPVKHGLTVADKGGGIFQVSGSIEAGEEITSVEVLDQDREVFAVDCQDEFKLDDNILFEFKCNADRKRGRLLEGEISVLNSSGWKFFKSEERSPTWSITSKGDKFAARFTSDHPEPHGFLFSIPKSDVGKAVILFDFPGADPLFIKTRDVFECGKVSYPLPQTFRVDVSKVCFLADIPLPLKKKDVYFSTAINSTKKFPIFQMRAVTSSGRVYRSEPAVPVRPCNTMVSLNIFSDSTEKPVDIQVSGDRIPDLRYKFTPKYGALLRNNYDQMWDAQLGGGYIYGEAFFNGLNLGVDKNLIPSWQKAKDDSLFEYFGKMLGLIEDRWSLDFNGDTQYAAFPHEAFPQAAFTLELEANFEVDNRAEIIFRHTPLSDGGSSLHLYRKDNKLFGYYNGRKGVPHPFDTGLALPAGEWTKIKVSYNLEKITFTVNSQQKEYKLYGERAWSYKPAVFGGSITQIEPFSLPAGTQMHWFIGQLRAFRILHNAE